MVTVRRTSQFKKDIKLIKKNIDVLKDIINKLVECRELEVKHRDHALVGGYKGSRECHIEPDWLLIYEKTEKEVILIRTGSHSDLF